MNESNYEVVNESVIETIKKAIKAIFRKIKELFDKVISFFRKEKGKQEDIKLKEEIKKAEENIKKEPKQTTNSTVSMKDTETSSDNASNTRQEPARIGQRETLGLPSFTGRTVTLYNEILYYEYPTLCVLNEAKIAKNIKNSIDYIELYDYGEEIRRGRDVREWNRSKLNEIKNNDKLKELVLDFYEIFIDHLSGHADINVKLNDDITSFPTNALQQLKTEIYNSKFDLEIEDYDDLKNKIKSQIKFAKNCINVSPTIAFEQCKKKISRIESLVDDILKRFNTKPDEAQSLLQMTSLLSTLLNNCIPVEAQAINRMKSNARVNLAKLNKLYNE